VLSSLRQEFAVAIAAAEPAIRVNTDEVGDAMRTIVEVAEKEHLSLRIWDAVAGVRFRVGTPPAVTPRPTPGGPAALSAPGASAAQTLLDFLMELPQPDPEQAGVCQTQILVMYNFHLAVESSRTTISTAMQHLILDKVGSHPKYEENRAKFDEAGIDADTGTSKFVVALMPQESKLPPELRPIFKVINHELPDQEELKLILGGIIAPLNDGQKAILGSDDETKIAKYALGLTRLQAEGVFSTGIAHYATKPDFIQLLTKHVWQEKSKILNEEGLVTLYQGSETFDNVVGLNGCKKLLTDLLRADELDDPNPELRSKGMALVGPPRTGKSLIAKAAGNSLELPSLMVDVGSWMGSFVGETEAKTRKGFQIIRALAPCIAIIDEVEKVMPSARGGDHDSGVSKRMAGNFMTALQDIKESVFWVFTANDVESLHEAFLADDRVDAVVYVHMPGPEQRAACWKMYIEKFFPAEVMGKAFTRHLTTDFDEVYRDYLAQPETAAPDLDNKLVAALMCMPAGSAQRTSALKIMHDYKRLAKITAIDDSTWTPARIKACCRLARKRRLPLSDIAKMMPRSQRNLEQAITRLERWAVDEAIDAETGEAYTVPELLIRQEAALGTKVRRSVRSTERNN
jgi:hypothetical protein